MKFGELLRRLLINPEEARLRSGWRLLAQFLLLILITIVFALPALAVMDLWPNLTGVALILSNGFPIVVSVFIARRLFDKRSVESLGLRLGRQAGRDVLVGIGIAAFQTGFVFVLQLAFGWAQVAGFAWQQQAPLGVVRNFILWLLIYLAVGFYEELFSRGYHLKNLEDGTNTFWAVLLSSMFFGVIHLFNPNASWYSAAGITLSGVFMAYAVLRTRQLWLSIGLHIGWNLFLGTVFGFPVSGLSNPGLIVVQVEGPVLYTGGAFGPEAGLVLLPALGVGAVLVWLVTRGRLLDK
ncbi:MAG TPA: type II CAAX endopeptidase family protein [Anaerolineales bacterium]|jgi:membrane protease YdiL (CAAX protease family)|nr:type II CAAX endopeptidase family protein [Anaerolineales bacterium]